MRAPLRRRRNPRCCSSLQPQPAVFKPLSRKEVALGVLHGRVEKNRDKEASEVAKVRELEGPRSTGRWPNPRQHWGNGRKKTNREWLAF